MGYLEDRRPAANMDPYVVCRLLLETIVLQVAPNAGSAADVEPAVALTSSGPRPMRKGGAAGLKH
jgi:hypothetical protein